MSLRKVATLGTSPDAMPYQSVAQNRIAASSPKRATWELLTSPWLPSRPWP